MNNEQEASTPGDEEAEFAHVPADFPRPEHMGAVSGFQSKLLLTSYKGKYYSPGCSPPELYAQWRWCEDLVQHLVQRSLESRAGKRSHMTEVEILDQYLTRLIATKWTSEPEARWVLRRTTATLGWPMPPAAAEN
jgi:hypothetical protein